MSALVVAAIIVLTLVALTLPVWWYLRRRRRAGRTFEGTFTFGWEVSSFVPGGPSETAPRYWVAWTPESGFMERFKAHGFDPAWSPGYGTVRTRFEGTLEEGATGGYGHMGQYSGQVTVQRVLAMSRPESGG